MAGKREIIRQHQCAYCRNMADDSVIKMCGGCKVTGYCSKECQKGDWKEHKPVCRQASDKTSAASRPPSIKVAMKMLQDDELMSSVDGIIIKCLDLQHHPENAEKYAVALSCRVESTETRMTVERIQYYINGQEPPPLPQKLPKLFQIGKAALIPNDTVPDGLDEVSERMRNEWQGQGQLKPEGKGILVRAFWVDEKTEMIDEVAGWMKPMDDESGPSGEPMTTEGLIKLFDVRALCEPEYKKKLTIMATTV